MIFEAASVYTSSENGEVRFALRSVHQPNGLRASTIQEAMSRPLAVRGLRLGDFALYASLADESGVAVVPYFVTSYKNEDLATIASSDLVLESPWIHVTRHLAASLQFIDPSGLEEFRISELQDYIADHFPDRTI